MSKSRLAIASRLVCTVKKAPRIALLKVGVQRIKEFLALQPGREHRRKTLTYAKALWHLRKRVTSSQRVRQHVSQQASVHPPLFLRCQGNQNIKATCGKGDMHGEWEGEG